MAAERQKVIGVECQFVLQLQKTRDSWYRIKKKNKKNLLLSIEGHWEYKAGTRVKK